MTAVDGDAWEGWAVLELMGHRRLGGYVSTAEVAGAKFLRIDVPGGDGAMQATQLYSAGAVYCITPTTEEIARAVGAGSRVAPVQRWELPAAAPASVELDDDDEDDDDDRQVW